MPRHTPSALKQPPPPHTRTPPPHLPIRWSPSQIRHQWIMNSDRSCWLTQQAASELKLLRTVATIPDLTGSLYSRHSRSALALPHPPPISREKNEVSPLPSFSWRRTSKILTLLNYLTFSLLYLILHYTQFTEKPNHSFKSFRNTLWASSP